MTDTIKFSGGGSLGLSEARLPTGSQRRTMSTPAFVLLVGKKKKTPLNHLDLMPLISAIVVLELIVPYLLERDK